MPVVGDWNSDGVDDIAVYSAGQFYYDSDGSGTYNAGDQSTIYGQSGDIAVAGTPPIRPYIIENMAPGQTARIEYEARIHPAVPSGTLTTRTLISGTAGSTTFSQPAWEDKVTVGSPPPTQQAAGDYIGRYGYTGREWEAEIDLQFNRGRYYDPATGRWISQDPLGFDAGDSNLYRYVHNRPTGATDPSGLEISLSELDRTIRFGKQVQTHRARNLGWLVDRQDAFGVGQAIREEFDPVFRDIRGNFPGVFGSPDGRNRGALQDGWLERAIQGLNFDHKVAFLESYRYYLSLRQGENGLARDAMWRGTSDSPAATSNLIQLQIRQGLLWNAQAGVSSDRTLSLIRPDQLLLPTSEAASVAMVAAVDLTPPENLLAGVSIGGALQPSTADLAAVIQAGSLLRALTWRGVLARGTGEVLVGAGGFVAGEYGAEHGGFLGALSAQAIYNRALTRIQGLIRRTPSLLDRGGSVRTGPQVAGTLQRDVGLVLNEQIAGGVGQGYAGHHLISIHLAEDSVAMQRAAQLGYNINRGSNGMALPTTLAESQASRLPLHSGRHLSARHAGSADAFVQQRLNALDARVRAGTITDQELLTEIGRLEDATRQALRTNQVRLQANDPHWRPPQ